MKIAHLLYESEGDAFGIGGAGVRAYEIYRRLRGRHDITLVCKRYPGARDREVDGLRHVHVGVESPSLTRTLLAYAGQARAFVGLRGSTFDVVVEEFSPAIPTFLHAVSPRPVVLQIQGYTGRHYFRKYNPAYAAVLVGLERLRPRFYRHVIMLSRHTAARVSLRKDARVAIVPNGIRRELLDRVPSEEDYVLYLGRLDAYSKGLDTLLRAYPTFFASCPDVRLVIAGDGKDRATFDAMVERLPARVRASVETPGWVSGERKLELLSRARFVVVPSRHEVQPLGALEAMACAKALLVSDIPELRDVADRGGGLAFRTGDADGLAQAMMTLIARGDLAQMGRCGRSSVQDDTWDTIALRFEAALRGAVER
jgi:glycosyltransferase involved in cell wall biosynthesis